MDNQATELNQLSRLLFDKAAFRWQWSIGLSFLSGMVAIGLSIIAPSLMTNAIFAGIAAAILILGYCLRFSFESHYDVAETMRRQSVLSEGLGWVIARSQFNEWRQRAGPKLLKIVAANPRPADYYATSEQSSPKRLAEMTFESLFLTKNLYRKVQAYLLFVILLTLLLIVVMLLIMPLFSLAESTRILLIYFVYLAIPVLVSIDLLGMYFRLQRANSSLSAIENHLEQLANESTPNEGEVLRSVAEYNCTLAAGLPIPNWVFKRHYVEIQACWT